MESGYFSLLKLDRELVIAEDSAATYKKTLDLFTQRFQFGDQNPKSEPRIS